MSVHVLDASAMVAYLGGEIGEDVVSTLLSNKDAACCAHAYNLCEVYYHLVRKLDIARAKRGIQSLYNDGVIVRRDLSRPFWQRVGELKTRGGISLPDCVCISLAQELRGEVVTSDHGEFDRLVPLGYCHINFIR